jgi:hypothetical protein
MLAQDAILVQLVRLIDRVPAPPYRPRRGRPVVYPDRLFLKALAIMLVRRLHKVHELLAVLAEPAPQMRALRGLLCEDGRLPSRRTSSAQVARPARDAARTLPTITEPPTPSNSSPKSST